MKKIKNKFIIWVISIIALIIFSQIYIAYSHSNVDTNSYLTLVEWRGTLNEESLDIQARYVLAPGDKVEIIGSESLWVIEWWDGSLTRLWGNTKISIEQNDISRDYTDINISFKLIAGKTWSNVISFIGQDSSFTQNFEGIEAWVRGTIFDVDLEKDFINVSDHQVELTDTSGKKTLVSEWKPVQISTLNLIELQEFLKNFQDTAWVELNQRFDLEYLWELKTRLEASLTVTNPLDLLIPNISKRKKLLKALKDAEKYEEVFIMIEDISEDEKIELYDAVLSEYQKLNFVEAKDYSFYKRKVLYKKTLLELSNNGNKEALVRSSLFDLQDIVDDWDQLWAQETLEFLGEYSDVVSKINTADLNLNLSELPDSLKSQFQDTFSSFDAIFDFDISNLPSSINTQEVGEKLRDGIWSIDKNVQDFIGDKAGGILNRFSQ